MDEQREALVKPLLIDKVKVCDYDISSVTVQKLLQAGICDTRDLRVRTPYEIRQEAKLSLFQYLRLFQYLHNNGLGVYEESEDKLTNNGFSLKVAKGIFPQEIGLSSYTIDDIYGHTGRWDMIHYHLKTTDIIVRLEKLHRISQERQKRRFVNPEIPYLYDTFYRIAAFHSRSEPYYQQDSPYCMAWERNTYEELVLRLREFGFLPDESDDYYNKYAIKYFGSKIEDEKLYDEIQYKLPWWYHFRMTTPEELKEKLYGIKNENVSNLEDHIKLTELPDLEASKKTYYEYIFRLRDYLVFPDEVKTVNDLINLGSEVVKHILTQEKYKPGKLTFPYSMRTNLDWLPSRYYCSLFQCGILGDNKTLKKCQSFSDPYERVIYSCEKAIDHKAISEFKLPDKLKDSLIKNNIFSFKELRLLSDKELLSIPGIGPQKLEYIRSFVASIREGLK